MHKSFALGCRRANSNSATAHAPRPLVGKGKLTAPSSGLYDLGGHASWVHSLGIEYSAMKSGVSPKCEGMGVSPPRVIASARARGIRVLPRHNDSAFTAHVALSSPHHSPMQCIPFLCVINERYRGVICRDVRFSILHLTHALPTPSRSRRA